MELKGIKASTVTLTTDGSICIEQFSNFHNKVVSIYLTLDQFTKIEDFVFKNSAELELAWNEGVENDSNS